jgi:hypothetical protein
MIEARGQCLPERGTPRIIVERSHSLRLLYPIGGAPAERAGRIPSRGVEGGSISMLAVRVG